MAKKAKITPTNILRKQLLDNFSLLLLLFASFCSFLSITSISGNFYFYENIFVSITFYFQGIVMLHFPITMLFNSLN